MIASSNTDALIPWLILNQCPGLNTKVFTHLFKYFENAQGIISAHQNQLKECGLSDAMISKIKEPDWKHIHCEASFAKENNQFIITMADSRYPPLLKEIADPPLLIYVQGNPSILSNPQIAIVGSRNPTPTAAELAFDFAFELANRGWIITSGLAFGIDSKAHQGTLQAKKSTIAVLGSGIKSIYPTQHQILARQIIAAGAVVSEFATMMPPLAQNFPQRNRIISGMSHGVLVVEATLKSGSLITARYAGEQGRDVFAIPGSIHNPQARGCHKLIREGAKLVESIEDILTEMSSFLTPPIHQTSLDFKPSPIQQLDKTSQILLDCAGYDVVSIDQLVSRSNLAVSTVTSNLLTLELQGLITSVNGGYLRVKK